MEKGKVALVTGSTSGIGLGILKKLASQGYHVVMNGLGKEQEIKALCKDIESKYNVSVFYHGADLTDLKQIEDLISKTSDKYGRLDVLVNCAGIQYVNPVETYPVDMWDKIIALNLSAVFHMSRLSLPLMKQNGWGRIINIGSAHSLVASPYKAAYVAAKHGVAGFAKSLALEVAQDNITCNTIAPGYVLTPLVEGQIDDTAKARGITKDQVIHEVMLGNQPTKKFVTIEEIANLSAFLCHEESGSITGSTLTIDGGWTAH